MKKTDQYWLIIIILVAVLVLLLFFPKEGAKIIKDDCKEIVDVKEKDLCYIQLAKEASSTEFCQNIQDHNLTVEHFDGLYTPCGLELLRDRSYVPLSQEHLMPKLIPA